MTLSFRSIIIEVFEFLFANTVFLLRLNMSSYIHSGGEDAVHFGDPVADKPAPGLANCS